MVEFNYSGGIETIKYKHLEENDVKTARIY